MRPQTVSQVGAGNSEIIKLDWEQARFNVGLQLVVDSAGATGAAIDVTLMDPDDPSAIYVEAFAASAAASLNLLETPCRAVRLNVTDGNYTLVAIQSS